MRWKTYWIGLALAFGLTWLSVAAEEPSRDCPGVELLVSQGWPAGGVSEFYYGGDKWPEMTSAIDAAAASVTVTPDLEDLSMMLLYDALWIDQRDHDMGFGPKQLTATEEANVAAYIDTGRRVVMIGENQNWTSWNEQILGLVGGVFEGEALDWTIYPIAVHPLTDGVSSVYVNAGGYCTGGLALFDWNFATEWGGSVVTVLDVNIMSELFWSANQNSVFATNLAAWIGCETPLIFFDGFETGDLGRWSAAVGTAATAEIHGFAWDDWITNGEQDYGFEGELEGWTVFVDLDSSGTLNPSTEPSSTVDGFGIYSLTGIAAGTHDVVIDLRDGWEAVSPATGSHSVSVSDGEIVGRVNFSAKRRTDTWDYGDAPDPTYPTFFQGGGAAHLVDPGLMLGDDVDTEFNGQPGPAADGDGADEDGVVFTSSFVRGQTASALVDVTGAGILNVWVDLGRDGFFAGSADHVVVDLPVAGDNIPLSFPVPMDAGFGDTYARFRVASSGGLGPDGSAPDGEVEDYLVTIDPEHADDFGDAPDTGYMTYGGSGGPSHVLLAGHYLGANVDGELDGQPNPDGTGDDLSWFDDEDGVDPATHLVPGDNATIIVVASARDYLDAWIDFDESGDWDPAERIISAQPLVRGSNPLTIAVPMSSTDGIKVSRFRMSRQGGVSSGGPLDRGEVEDLRIEVEYLDWGDAPDIDEGPFTTKIHSSAPAPSDRFGRAVDVDGDWAIVGSPFDGDGTATLFHRDGGNWIEEQEVSRGGTLRYGVDVAVEGDRAVVGQYGASSVDVYLYSGSAWALEQTISPTGGSSLAAMGKAVGMSGNRIIAGAPADEPADLRVGAAYVFEHDGSSWLQIAKLLPTQQEHGMGFGISVSIDGDLAVVGSPAAGDPPTTGSVHVFEWSGSAWGLTHEITPSSPVAYALFGSSVALDGERLVVGGLESTWVFHHSGGVWTQIQTLVGGGNHDNTSDVSGDWIVTGSSGDDDRAHNAGAARIYQWDGSAWSLWKKIYSPDPDDGHRFGSAVTLDDTRAIVGAENSDAGEIALSGAAYVFDWVIDEDHYPTLDVNNGAYHTAHPSFRLGAEGLDFEADGRPNADATGDDITGISDEHGVTFTSALVPGGAGSLEVIAPAGGLLDAWIDFNSDGDWDDMDEQILTNVPLTTGINFLGYNIPSWAVPTLQTEPTFARFRLSSTGGLTPAGQAPDGEVEDYAVIIEEP